MIEIHFPTFKKWYETPWMELIKHRLPRRRSWKTSLAESELPSEVQDRIHSIVTRTRLMRSEKREVCAELIAHFEDGLHADADPGTLLDRFGDASLAASLIRRAKKRNRSLVQKMARAIGWCGLGLATAYAIFAGYFLMGTPRPTTNYVQMYNAAAHDAKEEDRAWPIFRDAWIKFDFCRRDKKGQRLNDAVYNISDEGTSSRFLKPDDPNWPDAVNYLNEHREMLDLFRTAGAKPSLGFETSSNMRALPVRDQQALFPNWFDPSGELISDYEVASPKPGSSEDLMRELVCSMLLPHVQELRMCAHVLTVDTQLAVEQNDSDRAVSNIRATFGIAHQISETPSWVCLLVALAVSGDGFEQIEYAMNRSPDFFSDEQLRELQTLVVGLRLREFVKMEGERAMMYDLLQRCYTDNGSGDGRLTLRGQKIMKGVESWFRSDRQAPVSYWEAAFDTLAVPTSMLSVASRKETRDKYDEIMAAVEVAFDTPIEDDPFNVEDYLTAEQVTGPFRLFNQFFKQIDRIRSAIQKGLDRREAVVLMIETEMLKRKNGTRP